MLLILLLHIPSWTLLILPTTIGFELSYNFSAR
jgi:hypothetical protein